VFWVSEPQRNEALTAASRDGYRSDVLPRNTPNVKAPIKYSVLVNYYCGSAPEELKNNWHKAGPNKRHPEPSNSPDKACCGSTRVVASRDH
jgi:hypothetical protein